MVLVTGAGGSIGSELSRQIARVGPRRRSCSTTPRTTCFASSASSRTSATCTPQVLAAVLADCKEEERMREVFAEHRPTVVFHAAAYKHVALMEANPVEAVRNNALATRVVAHVAGELGVRASCSCRPTRRSTRRRSWAPPRRWPSSPSRRPAPASRGTRYAAVRFGNVLGSSGSVVPIFRRQIASGGPVTVTDQRMTRYFMTIPEAVQLVIRAGSLGDGRAEVFVLDMGEPVSILDLAREMIELSGLARTVTSPSRSSAAAPGEKLQEELFNAYERPQPTPAEKIMLAEREPLGP